MQTEATVANNSITIQLHDYDLLLVRVHRWQCCAFAASRQEKLNQSKICIISLRLSAFQIIPLLSASQPEGIHNRIFSTFEIARRRWAALQPSSYRSPGRHPPAHPPNHFSEEKWESPQKLFRHPFAAFEKCWCMRRGQNQRPFGSGRPTSSRYTVMAVCKHSVAFEPGRNDFSYNKVQVPKAGYSDVLLKSTSVFGLLNIHGLSITVECPVRRDSTSTVWKYFNSYPGRRIYKLDTYTSLDSLFSRYTDEPGPLCWRRLFVKLDAPVKLIDNSANLLPKYVFVRFSQTDLRRWM